MRVRERFINHKEQEALAILDDAASKLGLRVYSKPRLQDVIDKQVAKLTEREFSIYTKSHLDFLIVDGVYKPVMAVEYDGPWHDDPIQAERDAIKNNLCERAGLQLLRIDARHVTNNYGMPLLKCIVDVLQIEEGFYEAQASGQLPQDEVFCPWLIFGNNRERRFPYWLASQHLIRINEFVAKDKERGWFSIQGYDQQNNPRSLSYINAGDAVIYARASIRIQTNGPIWFDLLDEIADSELGVALQGYQNGLGNALAFSEFRKLFEKYVIEYKATPRSACGRHPFPIQFGNDTEWRMFMR